MTDTLADCARRVGEAVGHVSWCEEDPGWETGGCRACTAEAAALVELRALREECASICEPAEELTMALRAERDAALARVAELETISGLSARLLTEGTAENERLRAQQERTQEWLDRFQGDLAKAMLEIERLRAGLREMHDYSTSAAMKDRIRRLLGEE